MVETLTLWSCTQAKSLHVNFMWPVHVKLKTNFTWNSCKNYTWNSHETSFTCNSHAAILPVYSYWFIWLSVLCYRYVDGVLTLTYKGGEKCHHNQFQRETIISFHCNHSAGINMTDKNLIPSNDEWYINIIYYALIHLHPVYKNYSYTHVQLR